MQGETYGHRLGHAVDDHADGEVAGLLGGGTVHLALAMSGLRMTGSAVPGSAGVPVLGFGDLGLDQLTRLLVIALALEQGDDAEVDEAADADADRRGASAGLVVGHGDEVDGDGRDDRAGAEGHERAHDLGALQARELPDEDRTDDECGLGDGAEDGCFKHARNLHPSALATATD